MTNTAQEADVVTFQARQGDTSRRLFAGLKWEPRRTMLHLKEFDLDLTAYVFGIYGKLRNIVSGDIAHQTGEGQMIWHTGDDTDGSGNIGDDFDDERIYVEMDKLHEELSDIFFIVTSKNKFSFGDVEAPEVRLGDADSKDEYLHGVPGADGNDDFHAYIFAHVTRQGDMWELRRINQYIEEREEAAIEAALRKFLPDRDN